MNTSLLRAASVIALSAFAVNLAASAAASAQSMDELVAAAKKEGQLTTIALPHDWCGYGAVIDAFKKKYPEITVNELNPDAGSGDEIEAIKANKGNKGPQAPDVIDVGLSFGPTAKADGLIQPYKVSTWDEIPAEAKDADGYWYGDYYGVMTFIVNKDVVKTVPTDWADLLKPEYANSVALPGDPRTGNEDIQAIFAAGLSTTKGDVAKAAEAGLDFFAELNKSGNFVPAAGKTNALAQGTTPIVFKWDYNALAARDTLNGNPEVEIVVPKTGVVAGVYVQAISAFAPHPNAAKLWMEHLYSDEGQIGWLKGYCHPIRFNAMSKAGKIPADVLAKLPDPASYEKAVFPTLEQQNQYKAAIASGWDKVVGVKAQ
ncbi:iron ABC transporter substrate-binding protein [Aureimonas endophytica]|uniref:Iron ABC transporter substrate-binding protein n=1 Tax=Aureimonas endophytica TaxID=2027858 RepID=A0A916ZJ69_9HYPH|nr:ABC transporter substrate-binding protein [Aureimonas endophytica]GGE00816.1 iron ABC transporter substrate-binding protein [Aureimonas endophytica]